MLRMLCGQGCPRSYQKEKAQRLGTALFCFAALIIFGSGAVSAVIETDLR
jgi:hypothetical protein